MLVSQLANQPVHGATLADPVVPAEAYDRRYYLDGGLGSEEWRHSDGRVVSGLYPGMLARAKLEQRERVLDVGAGRGELVRVALESGAALATGVDYSADAVAMAAETLRVAGLGDRAQVVQGDARALSFDDGSFDLVTMIDVVEHLAPAELDATLGEARRVLRDGGRLFIHTTPNRLVYQVTYRLQRGLRPRRIRDWPADPRVPYEQRMHVSEQRLGTLRRALRRAGFGTVEVELGLWVHTKFVPEERSKRLYRGLAKLPLLRRFGIIDLYATAVR